ncbi:hypothetical protein HGM15179_012655 [Zosterops borbonicus]|uniref:Uncharacterized protein n=1 Tax=Zosterops borbonicus TaxID=364589 RepID=A0A8K1G9G1_9PASS|nr:hypothetical protein HGM15179_012655 [Zosterops borbonicus]
MEGEFNKPDLLLLDERLVMTWQCAPTAQGANCILSCIQSSVGSRILPLFSAHTIPTCSTASRSGYGPAQDMDLLEQWQRKAQKMKRLKHSDEHRLRKLELFSLKKRRLLGDHRAVSQYLKGT